MNKEMQETKLTIINKNKKVFSGKMSDLPEFFSTRELTDRVKICNADGLEVASMNCTDFQQLLKEDPKA